VWVSLDVPAGLSRSLLLRLRLPAGQQLGAVTVGGVPFERFADPETLDLTGLTGHVELVAQRTAAPALLAPR
jgi:hypothetical protein